MIAQIWLLPECGNKNNGTMFGKIEINHSKVNEWRKKWNNDSQPASKSIIRLLRFSGCCYSWCGWHSANVMEPTFSLSHRMHINMCDCKCYYVWIVKRKKMEMNHFENGNAQHDVQHKWNARNMLKVQWVHSFMEWKHLLNA